MDTKKGQLSVHSENLFPIIRQWLYSDTDIFVRELVSNACDAISKRSKMAESGDCSATQGQINVHLDKELGTLSFSDDGVGMTADEVDRYINCVAYSGLLDFVAKYEKDSTQNTRIIGHFGLGFYSAFMAADRVEIDSLSCIEGSEAVHWVSEEGIEFEMSASERKVPGTTITLHLNDKAKAEFTKHRLEAVLKKYCGFMPWPIDFSHSEASSDETALRINPDEPLWLKNAKDISSEEYIDFYKKTFNEFQDPVFWVHINMDYPFRLRGILYFPRSRGYLPSLEGRIRIFCNQVYVADNIGEIVPEHFFLLQGCLDCPDLPLNVSRSFLQSDETVRKLSTYITRKVADSLKERCSGDFESYIRDWPHLSLFVKYACMQDERFAEKAEEFMLFETMDGEFLKWAELPENEVHYAPEKGALTAYVDLAKAAGRKVLIFDHAIDNQFMSFLGYRSKGQRRFVRVDSKIEGNQEESVELYENLRRIVKEMMPEGQNEVSLMNLGSDALPIFFEVDEEGRRVRELMSQFESLSEHKADPLEDLAKRFPTDTKVILNSGHHLISKLAVLAQADSEKERVKETLNYLTDLALLAQNKLEGDAFKRFMARSVNLCTMEMEDQAE